jgi:hypothetical protein
LSCSCLAEEINSIPAIQELKRPSLQTIAIAITISTMSSAIATLREDSDTVEKTDSNNNVSPSEHVELIAPEVSLSNL